MGTLLGTMARVGTGITALVAAPVLAFGGLAGGKTGTNLVG